MRHRFEPGRASLRRPLAAVGLVALVAAVAVGDRSEREEPPWTDPPGAGAAQTAEVDAAGEGAEPPPGTLHLVLQEADCPEMRDWLDALVPEARGRGFGVSATVLAPDGRSAGTGASLAEARESLERAGGVVHTRGTSWTAALRSLGVARTPVILLTDPRGRLRALLPGDAVGPPDPPEEVIRYALEAL